MQDSVLDLIHTLVQADDEHLLEVIEAIQELRDKPIDGSLYPSSEGANQMAQDAIHFAMQYGFRPDLSEVPIEGEEDDYPLVDRDYEFILELMDEAEQFMNGHFSDDKHFWGNQPDLSDWGYWDIPQEVFGQVVFESVKVTRDDLIEAAMATSFPHVSFHMVDEFESGRKWIIEFSVKPVQNMQEGMTAVSDLLKTFDAEHILYAEVTEENADY